MENYELNGNIVNQQGSGPDVQSTPDLAVDGPLPTPDAQQERVLLPHFEVPVNSRITPYGIEVNWGDREFRIKTENPKKKGVLYDFREDLSDGALKAETAMKASPYTLFYYTDSLLPIEHRDSLVPEVSMGGVSLIALIASINSRRDLLKVGLLGTFALGVGIIASNNIHPEEGYSNNPIGNMRETIAYELNDKFSESVKLQLLFEAHKLASVLDVSDKIIKDKLIIASQFGKAPLKILDFYLRSYGDLCLYYMTDDIEDIITKGDVKFVAPVPGLFLESALITFEAIPGYNNIPVVDWKLRDLFIKHGLLEKSVLDGPTA